ncbi:uncharacterized protein B0H64DRAFT_404798 [Chaetomium fimeti]|uniref:Peptidase S8/S53 domain-containing protein n=1 Tax=Chaetomium fimeti TaxID=1854472 RepID=A0AAE0HBZ6_9PEZI|nr:hypothetical protein B0H64DRAFT_404798 [Chaetomium fimeti]
MEDMSEGKRPLTLAISNKNEGFVRTVLRSKHVRRSLVNLLGANREDTTNGIHLAIKTGLSTELTVELISKVTDQVLSRRDEAGLTPLHLAVEYERCTEAQLDVVKALLKHGDSALDVRTKVANLSVYRHHFDTRPKERDTGPAGATSSGAPTQRTTARWMRRTTSDLPQPTPQQLSEGQTRGSETGLDKKKLNQAKDGSSNQGDGELNDCDSHAPMPVPGADPRLPHNPTLAGDGTGTITMLANGKDIGSRQQLANVARRVAPQSPRSSQGHTPNLPPVHPARSMAKQSQGPKDGAIVTKVSADRISNELKLRYLRSTFEERTEGKERTQETATEFLYGGSRNTAREIYFNLLHRDEGKTELHEDALKEKGYKHLDFDTALRFVAVGSLVIRPTDARADRDDDDHRECGRKDMVKLFKWLRKDKGVKNIIYLRVQDDGHCPHTDRAIITALKDFEIDILDWTKPDLCPKTIQEACPKVRKLYLTWSGLNGMLLAWGGRDGLANLENLTDVYLRQTKYLEPTSWTNKKLADFVTLLQSSIPAREDPETKVADQKGGRTITVHPPEQPQMASASFQDPSKDPSQQQPVDGAKQERSKDRDGHEWLKIMDLFTQGIRELHPNQTKFDHLPDALKQEVRICLIDDGVDFDDRVGVRMEPGRAFGTESNKGLPDITVPYYSSATRHGTLMARMILRVCPNARIVPYRLDTRLGEDGLMHPTAKSAADALEHATESKNFDIVSMSWCIKRQSDNTKDVDRLLVALNKVVKDKLVFCSGPDVGSISGDELHSYYPVGHGDSAPFMFRIGAAKADGQPWPKVGGLNVVDYTLPGHKVRGIFDGDLDARMASLETGSSIATALAAGLAALMIHIVRMAAIRMHELGRQEWDDGNLVNVAALRAIKSRDKMRELFQDMTRHSIGTYVHVWPRFGGKGEDLEKVDDDAGDPVAARWKTLTQLARDIISSRDMVPDPAGRF